MDSSASRQIRTSYFTGFNSVRIALGLVLLIAAGLKGYEFATEPAVRVGLFESRWFLIGLIELEFSFGVWLLLGIYPRIALRIAILLFAMFTVISLFQVVLGKSSCGCFGTFSLSPWVTFLFDVLATFSLLRCRSSKPCQATAIASYFTAKLSRIRCRTSVERHAR
jgi:hypothetical protein